MGNMEKAIPKLIPFLSIPADQPYMYNQMFGHELAHSMEIVHRGQAKRLRLQNYGWPIGEFGHTIKTINIECRVFALQYLFEEAVLGHQCHDLLNLENACITLSSTYPFIWKSLDDRKSWLKESRPDYRICSYMNDHRPNFKSLLDTTVDYIVDKCPDLL